MNGMVRKLGLLAAGAALIACAALGYSAVSAGPAKAQVLKGSRERALTAGPIQLSNGEHALIGLLLPAVQLPAVQRGQAPFRVDLVRSDGSLLTELAVPRAPAGATRQTAFYDVSFADGSVRVLDRATGSVVFAGDLSDGMIIVVCLPAVQFPGNMIAPTAGSVQLMDPAGGRGQIVGMCDGSV